MEGGAVEVAKDKRPYLASPGTANKLVAALYAVLPVTRVVPARVDAQNLAKDGSLSEALGVAARDVPGSLIVGSAAVAERDVQLAVRTEGQLTAVVVELRLVDTHEHPPRRRVDHQVRRRPVPNLPLRDHALTAGWVDPRLGREVGKGGGILRGEGVEQPVALEARVERKPAQAARVPGVHGGGMSPFGLKRRLSMFIDESALAHETVIVNGGRRGLQIELSPPALVNLLDAKVADLC